MKVGLFVVKLFTVTLLGCPWSAPYVYAEGAAATHTPGRVNARPARPVSESPQPIFQGKTLADWPELQNACQKLSPDDAEEFVKFLNTFLSNRQIPEIPNYRERRIVEGNLEDSISSEELGNVREELSSHFFRLLYQQNEECARAVLSWVRETLASEHGRAPLDALARYGSAESQADEDSHQGLREIWRNFEDALDARKHGLPVWQSGESVGIELPFLAERGLFFRNINYGSSYSLTRPQLVRCWDNRFKSSAEECRFVFPTEWVLSEVPAIREGNVWKRAYLIKEISIEEPLRQYLGHLIKPDPSLILPRDFYPSAIPPGLVSEIIRGKIISPQTYQPELTVRGRVLSPVRATEEGHLFSWTEPAADGDLPPQMGDEGEMEFSYRVRAIVDGVAGQKKKTKFKANEIGVAPQK